MPKIALFFASLQSEIDKYRNRQQQDSFVRGNQMIGFIIHEKTFYLTRKTIKFSPVLFNLSEVVENEHNIVLNDSLSDVDSFQFVCTLLKFLAGYEIILPKNPHNPTEINLLLKKLQINFQV